MKKSTPRLIANLIFFYGAFFALFLTGIGIASGFSKNNFLTTLIFLPVTFFFLYELLRKFARSYRTIYIKEYQSNYFSITNFLSQRGILFTFNAVLLALALSVVLIRQSVILVLEENSTISENNEITINKK